MAQIFHWNDIYSLGISELDEQHKNIVDTINGLHEAIIDGRNKEVLSRILQELINDAQTHFSYEENLLKTHAYPDFEEHKEFHHQLATQVLDTQKRYLDGQQTLSVETTNYLKNWLSDHILRVDTKFIPYLKKT
jgi:hemerythrin